MPGYGKFRKVLLDGIYEEFYLITQLKREYELLFSFQLFLIGLKYEQMRKNIILQNILTFVKIMYSLSERSVLRKSGRVVTNQIKIVIRSLFHASKQI
mgnify:CR=1 FL=1